MCGISGIFSTLDNLHDQIDASITTLSHRGPDFIASKRITDQLSFGHSRLAIVDLNERANQPFFDPITGNYIIFNGEVYNFKALKKLLPKRSFHTNSDTEVLLYLLSDLNHLDVLQKCNGMFAFAFWNNQEKKLILGRDRMGQKPLFFFRNENTLAFASEVKALAPLGKKLEINHEAVINYLFEIKIGINRHSFFKGVEQLKNGSIATFSCKENQIVHEKTQKFWNFPKESLNISYQEATEELNGLLKSSINLRLSEEVKFAVMISGGMDSSSIASFSAAFNAEKNITSISAIYPGDERDESEYARMVTDKYSNLNPIWVDDINFERFNSTIKEVIYHQECPIADGSIVAQHILMKKIRDMGIRVILSGNGGDEILAGYPAIFLPAKEVQDLKNGKITIPSPRTLYHLLPNSIKNRLYVKKHTRQHILKDNSVLSMIWERYKDYGNKDFLNDYLINGLDEWTLPNLMWYEDRNSMSASIESRCPFLDHRIIELLLQVPASYKINGNRNKIILRDAAKGIVPQPIIDRTDKQGFHAPMNNWVKYIEKDFLYDNRFRAEFEYLDFEKIEKSPFRTYWRTYTLFLWFNEFINR